MFSSATSELVVYDYIMWLEFWARFWLFIKKQCRQRELQEELVWHQSCSWLWNVRAHKNVKWTCRLWNNILLLRKAWMFWITKIPKSLCWKYIKFIYQKYYYITNLSILFLCFLSIKYFQHLFFGKSMFCFV